MKHSRLYKLFATFFLLALSGGIHAANVFLGPHPLLSDYGGGNGVPTTLRIEGPIQKGDLDRAVGLLLQNSTTVKSVALSGVGGDFEEAMRMSSLFTTLSLETVVVGRVTCGGPCFVAWFGGNPRNQFKRPILSLYLPTSADEAERVAEFLRVQGGAGDLMALAFKNTQLKLSPVRFDDLVLSTPIPLPSEMRYLIDCGATRHAMKNVADRERLLRLDAQEMSSLNEQYNKASACFKASDDKVFRSTLKDLSHGWRP